VENDGSARSIESNAIRRKDVRKLAKPCWEVDRYVIQTEFDNLVLVLRKGEILGGIWFWWGPAHGKVMQAYLATSNHVDGYGNDERWRVIIRLPKRRYWLSGIVYVPEETAKKQGVVLELPNLPISDFAADGYV